jgi:hypothetical protein
MPIQTKKKDLFVNRIRFPPQPVLCLGAVHGSSPRLVAMVTVLSADILTLMNTFLDITDVVNLSRTDKAHRGSSALTKAGIRTRVHAGLLDIDYEFGLDDGTLRQLTSDPFTFITGFHAAKVLVDTPYLSDKLVVYANAERGRWIRMFLEKNQYVQEGKSQHGLPTAAFEQSQISRGVDMSADKGRRFKNVFSITHFSKPVGVRKIALNLTVRGRDMQHRLRDTDFLDKFKVTEPHFKKIKLVAVLGDPREVIAGLDYSIEQVLVNDAGVEAVDDSTFEDCSTKTLRMCQPRQDIIVQTTNAYKENAVHGLDGVHHDMLMTVLHYKEDRGYNTGPADEFLRKYLLVIKAIKHHYVDCKNHRNARIKALKEANMVRRGDLKRKRQ